jgi:4-carboxymuconolactone decarboxylase
MNDEERYDTGMETRRAVLGDAHVDRALASVDPLSVDLQTLVTQFAWGMVWTRPQLERAQRSLITVALLVALNRQHELRAHLQGAINNGVTRDQIAETILHCSVYCGFPAALDAMRVAREVLNA